MGTIDYSNLLSFLNQLPQECDRNIYEEMRSINVPGDWKQIGSLVDKRISGFGTLYKPWTDYALGFYPYNMCDIYQDNKGRVLLSYEEWGGHAPFRRSFIATKTSPFIHEPVSCNITVLGQENDRFIAFLEQYGLTASKIQADISKYKNVHQITENIDKEDTIITKVHHNSVGNEYYYTLITKRENAVVISQEFNKNSR
ncbi:hypothetical protein [Cesiribacter sp. SM1]|uniref:hypothetical protein n=1 Tax=Cesiribacter sp. SM1 TaxID=2861196 RepID=UPI001CD4FA1D|nr:hypothetical protein [Cesiribacter sp. SM1]